MLLVLEAETSSHKFQGLARIRRGAIGFAVERGQDAQELILPRDGAFLMRA